MGKSNPGGNPNWVKGGPSPNPGGRPKLVDELRQRALKAVDDKVLAAWIDEVTEREREVMTFEGPITQVCRGPNWVKCSELLAAYGMGKPVQPVESKVEVTHGTREMSRAQLMAIAAGEVAAETEH